MKPPLSALETEQMYFQCDEPIGDIKAGSPVTLWGNGSELQLSDWSDPKNIRFMALTLVDFKVVFEAGTITVKGYECVGRGRYIRYGLTFTTYKP